MTEQDVFDLFGEPTEEEDEKLKQIQQDIRSTAQDRLDAFPPDPAERTLSDNRWIFNQRRRYEFEEPGIQKQVLSPDECQSILKVVSNQVWTGSRHSAFATTDIPIRSHPKLNYLVPLIKTRLFPSLANHYGFKVADLDFRDIFLIKYDAQGQTGLDLHSDGCLFSLTLLISHPDDFEGGGTYYASIDKVIQLDQGDCAHHNAHIMHSGVDITKGTRYVLVGFIDTIDTIVKDSKISRVTN
ncbi:hypothetical protein BD560DRAFT_436509 [Blakeslea trispora]|nr:hypothetical protein BD560DRAFT_436509 [Blakeslea trispora]